MTYTESVTLENESSIGVRGIIIMKLVISLNHATSGQIVTHQDTNPASPLHGPLPACESLDFNIECFHLKYMEIFCRGAV